MQSRAPEMQASRYQTLKRQGSEQIFIFVELKTTQEGVKICQHFKMTLKYIATSADRVSSIAIPTGHHCRSVDS